MDLLVIGTDFICRYKSSYHTITAMTFCVSLCTEKHKSRPLLDVHVQYIRKGGAIKDMILIRLNQYAGFFF